MDFVLHYFSGHNRSNMIKNIIKLISALIMIYFTGVVLLPFLSNIAPAKQQKKLQNSYGIDASGLFYTDTYEFSAADNFFNNARMLDNSSIDSVATQ